MRSLHHQSFTNLLPALQQGALLAALVQFVTGMKTAGLHPQPRNATTRRTNLSKCVVYIFEHWSYVYSHDHVMGHVCTAIVQGDDFMLVPDACRV